MVDSSRNCSKNFGSELEILISKTVETSGLIIFAIVNNGNILTDGRRYRKRPRIEM